MLPGKPISPPETHQERAVPVNVSMSYARSIPSLRYGSHFHFLHFSFIRSSGTSLSTEAPANRYTVPVGSDNGGKQTGHHYDDGNSPISQTVPNVQASTSHTANTIEPTIPTPFENGQQARTKRKPGSGRPKGRKSTVAPKDRPRRLSRPPGTGHLQRAGMPQPEKRPTEHPPTMQILANSAVSGHSRPFNLVCFFISF